MEYYFGREMRTENSEQASEFLLFTSLNYTMAPGQLAPAINSLSAWSSCRVFPTGTVGRIGEFEGISILQYRKSIPYLHYHLEGALGG